MAHDEFRIDRMTREDLPEILAIERACFPVPWSRECFLSEVDNIARSHPRVIRRHGRDAGPRAVGYACLWQVHDEIWINNFAVHASYRRRGLGTRLLRETLSLARRLGCVQVLLEVRPSNEEAIRLYESEGFREIGRRRRYYTDNNEDALLMAVRFAASRRVGWRAR